MYTKGDKGFPTKMFYNIFPCFYSFHLVITNMYFFTCKPLKYVLLIFF